MDSLQLLNPCPSTHGDSPRKNATAWLLEQLTRRVSQHINDRDWSHPDWRECMAPDFQVYVTDKESEIEYLE